MLRLQSDILGREAKKVEKHCVILYCKSLVQREKNQILSSMLITFVFFTVNVCMQIGPSNKPCANDESIRLEVAIILWGVDVEDNHVSLS